MGAPLTTIAGAGVVPHSRSCNSRRHVILLDMRKGDFWALLPENIKPDPSVVEILLQLEQAGWKARKFVAGRTLRLWPDNERAHQFFIDLFHPVVEHKLDFYRGHTQLDLQLSDSNSNEGGKG